MHQRVTRRIAAVAISAAAVLTAGLIAPAQAALPSVDMEAVAKAAQIDPRRPGTGLTPGAKDSVLAVERALDAKNLLSPTYVDGHFGSRTVEAYAAYQAERRLGRQVGVTQGSYNAGGVGASAGTHDGGGALDISVSGLTAAQRTATVKALRQVGFAAWLRTPAQGDWGYHIHAIAINDTDLSSGAQHQAGDYYLGENGLADGAPDDGPQVTKVTWEEYQRSR